MKTIRVAGYEADEINAQISRILRGLGCPEPPIRLEDVRELQALDRQFYSSNDHGAVREVVSRLRVAGIQILRRPTILWDAIKKADISAIYLPDRKRILIDSSKPKIKHRWSEAHEIAHSVIPWHQEMNLGDTRSTLTPECHAIVEAEANNGAGGLLFLQERFKSDARDCGRAIESVTRLSRRYGNTLTSTLWRYVENAMDDVPVVGIVSQHPRYPDGDFDPNQPRRYCVQSPAFRECFATASEKSLFAAISTYCAGRRSGPLGQSDLLVRDDNGDRHVFHFESFSNTFEVLTLGVHLRAWRVAVAVP